MENTEFEIIRKSLEKRQSENTTYDVTIREEITRTMSEMREKNIRITATTSPLSGSTGLLSNINFLAPESIISYDIPLVDIRIIDQIKDNFDDLQTRQIYFFQFKKHIENIRSRLTKRSGKSRVFVGLVDSLMNIKSEDLSLEQLSLIGEIVRKLNLSIDLNDGTADKYLQDMMKAKLTPFPEIEITDLPQV